MEYRANTHYLVEWKDDGALAVTDGWNLNAIRHSERKHYGGAGALCRVLRVATEEDKRKYPMN